MQYLLMALFAGGIVALDQLSKNWVVHNIASNNHLATLKEAYHLTEAELSGLPSKVDGVEGIFHLSHTHNTGAAWSSFEGMRWLFVAIFALFAVFLVWEFAKNRFGFTKLEKWFLVAVFAGGLGNVIDRIRLGFVVDMIQLDFMKFPVFNVADCFITCGCIALIAHLIFFNKAFWKEDKK